MPTSIAHTHLDYRKNISASRETVHMHIRRETERRWPGVMVWSHEEDLCDTLLSFGFLLTGEKAFVRDNKCVSTWPVCDGFHAWTIQWVIIICDVVRRLCSF